MKLNLVPARTGITWVKLGIQTFLKQPLALAGLFFLYMATVTFISLIPWIGPVLALSIVPACTLGLMAATEAATLGRFPMPAILLSAFRADRQRARAMLILGALYAAACMVIFFVVPLFFNAPLNAEKALTPEMQVALLAVMVLYLPVSVLFWHAPALVHWHGIAPVKSLFFSAVVCWRNAGAYTVYGLAWLAVFAAFGLAASMLAALLPSVESAQLLLLFFTFLMAAMFSASLYFTFRDSFDTSPTDKPILLGDTP